MRIIYLIFFMTVLVLPFGRLDWGEGQERPSRERIISTFSGKIPQQWGERVKGVKTKLDTNQRVLALTFDACGGPKGSGYDAKIMECLEREQISATLFISGRWIDVNLGIFKKLAQNPLFDIENHGLNHKPCSAIGRSAYGIKGTKSVEEIFSEIEENALKIQILTGRKPKYYRPGTAFCDEICVEIANWLGYEVVNFSVRGDAGATYSKRQIKEALRNAPPSSIILMHMNQPEKETAEGFTEALSELKKAGFRLTKLSEFGLR